MVGRWRRSTGNCRRLELSSSLLALLDEERQALGTSTGRGSIVRESSADGSECRIVYSRCESAALGDIIVDEMARSHKRACTLEWKVYGHDHPPELPERLAEAGFKAADRESVLVLPLPTASLIPSPPPEIRRYVDDRGLSDHESIARALERPNATQERDRLAAEMKEHPGEMCIHVAYVAGLPVACGRLYLRAGGRVAELAGGRTHPEYRQQGLFTALVASRVAEAGEDGRELVLVDAMTTSEPILVKLGFSPLTWTRPFVFEPSPSDRKPVSIATNAAPRTR